MKSLLVTLRDVFTGQANLKEPKRGAGNKRSAYIKHYTHAHRQILYKTQTIHRLQKTSRVTECCIERWKDTHIKHTLSHTFKHCKSKQYLLIVIFNPVAICHGSKVSVCVYTVNTKLPCLIFDHFSLSLLCNSHHVASISLPISFILNFPTPVTLCNDRVEQEVNDNRGTVAETNRRKPGIDTVAKKP